MKEIDYYLDLGATHYRESPEGEVKEILIHFGGFVWTPVATDQTVELFLESFPDAQYYSLPKEYNSPLMAHSIYEIDWDKIEKDGKWKYFDEREQK